MTHACPNFVIMVKKVWVEELVQRAIHSTKMTAVQRLPHATRADADEAPIDIDASSSQRLSGLAVSLQRRRQRDM